MKIAPEHTEEHVLALMHKEAHQQLLDFLAHCRQEAAALGKKILFTPYVIASHPGCTPQDTEAMIKKFKALDLPIKQFQDFTPTPGTLSTASFVTGLHRDCNQPIPVMRNQSERMEQRRQIEKQLPGKVVSTEQIPKERKRVVHRKNNS
jgi:hypothetical protein